MTRLDPRVKLVLCLVFVSLSLVSPGVHVPLTAAGLSALLLALSGVSIKGAALRAVEPVTLAVMLAALQAFIASGAPMYCFGILGFELTVTHEGMHKGALMLSRVVGAVGAVLFLSMTTPVSSLMAAAAWFRLPRGLVEVMMFTYRYVFTLIEDAASVCQAQRMRLGYRGLRRSLGSLGTLAGAVFVRAFAQAEATGTAMMLRGYTGSYLPSASFSLRMHDLVFAALSLLPVVSVLAWTC
jgi:cobalt/nickel transport system permease protein